MRRTHWAGLILVLLICALSGCIGRQPSQQGTWSGQDGFKHQSTEAAHTAKTPEHK